MQPSAGLSENGKGVINGSQRQAAGILRQVLMPAGVVDFAPYLHLHPAATGGVALKCHGLNIAVAYLSLDEVQVH